MTSHRSAIEAILAKIDAVDPRLGAFTAVTRERALAKAEALDRGEQAGPLAGMTFAVKNLFDVEGLSTLAGSKINRDHAPAARDAFLIRRLEAAGAVLVGALNMGEYAYDFTGENAHDGASKNPHDLSRMSGGSSGGSGSAAAAGLVNVTLGSDTNGSIRVPSAFCGLFGLKPTFGRLSRGGSFPFVASFDHLGPMGRSVADIALAYDAIQGIDPDDPWQADRLPDLVSPVPESGISGLRIGVAGGYFATGGDPECFAAVKMVADALGTSRVVELPEPQRARAAAFVITASEGSALHLDRLRTRAADFDPAVRDRLIAGAMIPAAWVQKAQRFRRWYRHEMLRLFEDVDVILAPSTPCRAPKLGQQTIVLGGVEMPLRPNIGVFTQPISFIGLPVAAVPVWPDDGLPLGVQVIAAPWREDVALRVARALEKVGIAKAPVAEI
jgi:aspartyl-tRNA(Asn)/glutamyl-tRNA(Gln) amidotransferase subunit A